MIYSPVKHKHTSKQTQNIQREGSSVACHDLQLVLLNMLTIRLRWHGGLVVSAYASHLKRTGFKSQV